MRSKFGDSHSNEKSPNPTAEQVNVIVPYNFVVMVFGSMVTLGGDTNSIKY